MTNDQPHIDAIADLAKTVTLADAQRHLGTEPIEARSQITPLGEPIAALPECEHCDGTGKNLTGSPWERT